MVACLLAFTGICYCKILAGALPHTDLIACMSDRARALPDEIVGGEVRRSKSSLGRDFFQGVQARSTGSSLCCRLQTNCNCDDIGLVNHGGLSIAFSYKILTDFVPGSGSEEVQDSGAGALGLRAYIDGNGEAIPDPSCS